MRSGACQGKTPCAGARGLFPDTPHHRYYKGINFIITYTKEKREKRKRVALFFLPPLK